MLLPFPMSRNLEGELSATHPMLKIFRSRVAAVFMLMVSLLIPINSFAATCKMDTLKTCQDATPCKVINGANVCLNWVNPLPPAPVLQSKQECWDARANFTCMDGIAVNDTCQPLKDRGCGVIGSKCIDNLPNSTECSTYTDTYQCQTGGVVATTSTDCSGQSYCSNGTCFTKKDAPNNALAKVVTAMELSRQAGFYVDPLTMEVFTGVVQVCSQNNLGWADCCKPSGEGMSYSNAIIVTELIKMGWNSWVKEVVGSSYTFDTLFDGASKLVDRAVSGMSEVVNGKEAVDSSLSVMGPPKPVPTPQPPGAGVGGMVGGMVGAAAGGSLVGNMGGNANFQAVGASLGYVGGAVAGTYLGAGGYALVMGYGTTSAGTAAAGSAMGAVSICWVCIIAVAIIMLVMALLACTPDELKTQMKLGVGICHHVGGFCSQKSFWGSCFSTQQNYCCFNSKLAKIVQEQGRPQIGKDWGSPETPNCSGFSVDQLQNLDFSKMDLSEFIADVKSKATPDAEALAQDVANSIGDYFDSGNVTTSNGVIPGPTAGTPTLINITSDNTVVPVAPMRACNSTVEKQVLKTNEPYLGVIKVTQCVPNALLNWIYTGDCPELLQGVNIVENYVNAAGEASLNVSIPVSCNVDNSTIKNMWDARVIDTASGGISGRFNTVW